MGDSNTTRQNGRFSWKNYLAVAETEPKTHLSLLLSPNCAHSSRILTITAKLRFFYLSVLAPNKIGRISVFSQPSYAWGDNFFRKSWDGCLSFSFYFLAQTTRPLVIVVSVRFFMVSKYLMIWLQFDCHKYHVQSSLLSKYSRLAEKGVTKPKGSKASQSVREKEENN